MRHPLVALCAALLGCGPAVEGQLSLQEPPEDAVGGFEMTLPSFTLQPGEERLPCFVVPLVLSGPSHLVAAAVLTTGPGLHHGNITTRPQTADGACDPNEHIAFDIFKGGTVLFGSSTQISGPEWLRLPAGHAFRVKDGHEIVARMHYLNTSGQPLTITPRYRWFTVPEASVTQEVGPYAWTYDKFTIPPRSQRTVRARCDLPRPMRLLTAMPHMHELGRRFQAGFLGGPRDGQTFLDQADYNARGGSDIRVYQPAVDLSQGGEGGGFFFSCEWDNTHDKAVRFGVGINEMCILFGYAYPPEDAFSAEAGDGFDCYTITAPKR